MTIHEPELTTRGGPALVSVDGRTYPLESVRLTARAEGGLALSRLTQRFANPYDQTLEVVYTLPLPAEGAVLGYTVLTILWGAYVRATGSGAGCGRHWPLCNGEVLPRAPGAAMIIEFSHRATAGSSSSSIAPRCAYSARRTSCPWRHSRSRASPSASTTPTSGGMDSPIAGPGSRW